VTKRKIFFAILDMGLGHATRSLPIIKKCVDLEWQVIIGCSGRSLIFLEKELPKASFIEMADYGLQYSEKGVSIINIVLQFPRLLRVILSENRFIKQYIHENKVDVILSDHRYGCFSKEIPSFFLTHQLRFIAPKSVRCFEFLGVLFNNYFHSKYTAVIIPDTLQKNQGLISGNMSKITAEKRYHFAGVLSSLSRQENLKNNIDVFISISGPEPQRTVLERIIRAQINDVPGKKVMTLGLPESDFIEHTHPDVLIYHHLGRTEMELIMNRSRLIISRSGFSTIMELAELTKKALFIPTPGQTEQLYLAKRLYENKWFHFVQQDKLNLRRDIPLALRYPGFPEMKPTAMTVDYIIKLIMNYEKGAEGESNVS
jgi:uncharacterized protein (TIGR00661 family)